MDTDDLDDAIRCALPPGPKPRGAWVEPAVASDRAVAGFKLTLGRLLENCPGDVTIAELRELLDE